MIAADKVVNLDPIDDADNGREPMRDRLGKLFQIEGGQGPAEPQCPLAKANLHPIAAPAEVRMPVQFPEKRSFNLIGGLAFLGESHLFGSHLIATSQARPLVLKRAAASVELPGIQARGGGRRVAGRVAGGVAVSR